MKGRKGAKSPEVFKATKILEVYKAREKSHEGNSRRTLEFTERKTAKESLEY